LDEVFGVRREWIRVDVFLFDRTSETREFALSLLYEGERDSDEVEF